MAPSTRGVWYTFVIEDDLHQLRAIDTVECKVASSVVALRNAIFHCNSNIKALQSRARWELVMFASHADLVANIPLEGFQRIEAYGVDGMQPVVAFLPVRPLPPKLCERRQLPLFDGSELELLNTSLEDDSGRTIQFATPTFKAFWTAQGDFPDSYVMRMEERFCWAAITKSLEMTDVRTVVLGSPGVGKSALVVLAAMRLAIVESKKVVVLRRVKADTCSVVFFHGDGKYQSGDTFNSESGPRELRSPVYVDAIKFVDGFTQGEMRVRGALNRFDVLATSCQYEVKVDSTTTKDRLVLLPAWRIEELVEYAGFTQRFGLLNDSKLLLDKTKERYYHTGGSLRAFCMTDGERKEAIERLIRQVDEATLVRLVQTRGASETKGQVDSIRRHFVIDRRNRSHYNDVAQWLAFTDIEFFVRTAGKKVSRSQQLQLYRYARQVGGGFLGTAFELSFHRATEEWQASRQQLVIHTTGDSKYTKFCIKASTVSCSGDSKRACDALLEFILPGQYWYPSYPTFPFVDAITVCDAYVDGEDKPEQVLVYLQMTVGKKKTFRADHLKQLNTPIDKNKALAKYKAPLKRVFVIVTNEEATSMNVVLYSRPDDSVIPVVFGYFNVEEFFREGAACGSSSDFDASAASSNRPSA